MQKVQCTQAPLHAAHAAEELPCLCSLQVLTATNSANSTCFERYATVHSTFWVPAVPKKHEHHAGGLGPFDVARIRIQHPSKILRYAEVSKKGETQAQVERIAETSVEFRGIILQPVSLSLHPVKTRFANPTAGLSKSALHQRVISIRGSSQAPDWTLNMDIWWPSIFLNLVTLGEDRSVFMW